MEKEKYTPSPEEMKAAEESLTPVQEEMSEYRGKAHERLKKLYERAHISPENFGDVNIKIEQLVEREGSYPDYAMSGEIKGHEVFLKRYAGAATDQAEEMFRDCEIDGLPLDPEFAKKVYVKYAEIAAFLIEYNQTMQDFRRKLQKERRIPDILKDIL